MFKINLKVEVKTSKGTEVIVADQVLSAVGVVGNIENLGLEKLGIKTERGSIVTDEFSRTNVPGVYAIGDVAGAPWSFFLVSWCCVLVAVLSHVMVVPDALQDFWHSRASFLVHHLAD